MFEVDADDVRNVQSIELVPQGQQFLQGLSKDLFCHLVTLIVATQHGDGLHCIIGIEVLDDGLIALPPIIGQGVIDCDDFPWVQFCLPFVVEHLDDVAELLTIGRDPRDCSGNGGKGLRGGKGKDQAKLGLVIPCGLFGFGEGIEYFGVAPDLMRIGGGLQSLHELLLDCCPEDGGLLLADQQMMDFDAEVFKRELLDGLCQLQLGLVFVDCHALHLLGTWLWGFLFIVVGFKFVLAVRTVPCNHIPYESSFHGQGSHYHAQHHLLLSQYIYMYDGNTHFPLIIFILTHTPIEKMSDNPVIQFDPRRQREQAELKVLREVSQRLLPKGTCALEEYKKYDYIRAFLKDRFVYRYIVPINHVYAPFVVICRKPQEQKYPLYQLYHRPTSSFVLSAQEQTMSIGCNYLISTKQKPAKNEFFIAKLRSNFSRDQFNIFDNGNNPERAQGNPRRQLGFITVGESAIWSKDERLAMYVPRAYESNRSISQIHKYQPIEFLCQTSNPNPILQDFKEKYNTVQSLHLKEKGKGTGGTGKEGEGFILESSVRTQTVVVRRKSETYFQLGIGSPLTIVQGFAFLLAMVQAKLI